MKQKVSLHQIKTYCEAYGIDRNNIFEYPRDQEKTKQIAQIFEAFTDVKYTDKGIVIKVMDPMGKERELEGTYDDVPSFWESRSLDELHEQINQYLKDRSKAYSQIAQFTESLGRLGPDERQTFEEIINKSNEALSEINRIAKKRPLSSDDLLENERLDYIQRRIEVIKDLESPKLEVTVAPMNEDGSAGERQTIILEETDESDYQPISIEEVKDYLKSDHTINAEELFKEGSFLRQTKDDFDALNGMLYHFTEHRMKEGVGMEYSLSESEEKKIVYQRVTSFDEISGLDELVWHMNRIQRQKTRNVALINQLEKLEEKKKRKNNDRDER